MKQLIFLFISGIFFVTGCFSNVNYTGGLQLTEGTPESAGMSQERLAWIDTMCIRSVENGDVPGMVVLVARHGRIVYNRAFGMADNASGREMKTDDIFRIASQSKAITATAVMMLWEEGKFSLDDSISKFIPEFSHEQVLREFNPADTSYTTVPAVRPITIRHLLTHTSGIGYGIIDRDKRFRMIYQKAGVTDLYTTKDVTIEQSVKKLARLPLHSNPGEQYNYSEGLDVLGYFVEIMSGMPFDEFLRTRLFDPLGMDDTWFYLPEEKYDRLVSVQEKRNGEWVRFPVTFYDPDYPIKGARTFFSGGAGLSSTVKDYATFLQMYLNGGEMNGHRFLSRTTVTAIMGNQFPAIWPEGVPYYGLAFEVTTDRQEALGGMGSAGTFRWGGYFNTQYFADPVEGTIGLIFKQTQGFSGDQTEWKFKQLTGQAIDD